MAVTQSLRLAAVGDLKLMIVLKKKSLVLVLVTDSGVSGLLYLLSSKICVTGVGERIGGKLPISCQGGGDSRGVKEECIVRLQRRRASKVGAQQMAT